MKNKKGFISITIVYTFVVVFLLIMLAMIASYSNKRYLKTKIKLGVPDDNRTLCKPGITKLSSCLFKGEYSEYLKLKDDSTNTNTNYNIYNTLNESAVKNSTNDNIITNIINNRTNLTHNNYQVGATMAEGMYSTQDEGGRTTYFYRGDVSNNYVSFAGFTWRIVRINGDGSIRLILNDIPNTANELISYNESQTEYKASNKKASKWCENITEKEYFLHKASSLLTPFQTSDDYKFCEPSTRKIIVGLKYYNPAITDSESWSDFWNRTRDSLADLVGIKDILYANEEDSDILKVLKGFYTRYLSSYSKYIDNNSTFCADKNVAIDLSSEEGAAIANACNNSFNWGPNKDICTDSNFLSSLNNGLITYKGLSRIFNYQPEIVCGTSCDNAGSVCHQATNLSLYSVHGNVKYALSDDNDLCNKECASSCGKCKGDWLATTYDACTTGHLTGDWEYNHISKYKIKSTYTKLQEAFEKYRNNTSKNSIYGSGGNGQLGDYAIGLISADEAMMSGASYFPNTDIIVASNKNFSSSISPKIQVEYTYNSNGTPETDYRVVSGFWTGTTAYTVGNEGLFAAVTTKIGSSENAMVGSDIEFGASYYFIVDASGKIKIAPNNYLEGSNSLIALPVINIKDTTLYKSGSGTYEDPYVIN